MNTNKEIARKPHLSKEQRLPRSYKDVLKILKTVKTCEANVKTALHNAKLPPKVIGRIYALTVNILKQSKLLDAIMQEVKLLEKEPFLRKEVAELLIYELIFGKGLQGESKQVMTLKKYQYDIEMAYRNLQDKLAANGPVISIPKYVRINTLISNMEEVLKDLEYQGLQQIFYEETISETEYFDLVKNLKCGSFLIDYHFKDLLVFPNEENLSSWSLYQNGCVFIQDKSSYIPAHVLNPEPGSTVLDACAAPGMKTLHLLAVMQNKGVLYACEKNEARFKILEDMLQFSQSSICQTFCKDFSLIDVNDEKFASVEYILLDPTCSGSGMVSRMDSVTDTESSKNNARLQNLAGFQIVLLKHALTFPSVKRIVYSTCSTTETENEYVIHEVLSHFSQRFKLVEVLPDWPIRGSDKYEFGPLCLRAYPEKCLTNGFFVAMFERIDFPDEQIHYSYKKKSRKRRNELTNDDEEYQQNQHTEKFHSDEKCNFSSKHLYSKKSGDSGNQLFDQNLLTNDQCNSLNEHNTETKLRKKKSKRKFKKNDETFESNNALQNFLCSDKNEAASENACSDEVQILQCEKGKNELGNGENSSEVFQQLENKKHKKKRSKDKNLVLVEKSVKLGTDTDNNFKQTDLLEDNTHSFKTEKTHHKRKRSNKELQTEINYVQTSVYEKEKKKSKTYDFQGANMSVDGLEKSDESVVKKHKKKHKNKRKHSEEKE